MLWLLVRWGRTGAGAKMEADEIAALCPIENVVRELTGEEEWQCLAKVIAPETVALIRASLENAA